MVLVRDRLFPDSRLRSTLPVDIVFERAFAVEFERIERARHRELHAETEEVRRAFAHFGHVLGHGNAAVPGDGIAHLHLGQAVGHVIHHFHTGGIALDRHGLEFGIQPSTHPPLQPGAEVILRDGTAEAGHERCREQLLSIQPIRAERTRRRVDVDREILPVQIGGGHAVRRFTQEDLVMGYLRAGRQDAVRAAQDVTDVEIELAVDAFQVQVAVAQVNRDRLLRSSGRRVTLARQDGHAVCQDLPAQHVATQVDEEILVVHLHAAVQGLLRRRRSQDGTVAVTHLPGMGMPGPVGGDDTVAVEGVVGRIVVVEVAAKGVDVAGARFVRRPADGLVHEVPDAAALQFRILPEEIHIILEAAHRVAHGMRILAHDDRTGNGRILSVFDQVGIGHVHVADDVRIVLLAGALILDRAGRIPGLQPVVGGVEILPVAGLVAKAPDDHARVVEVALRHTLHTLQVGLLVDRVVAQRRRTVTHAVRLDVGLGDDVETVAVAEREPARVIGIMAGSYRIDVQFLHDADILQHLCLRDHVAALGGHLVAVGALDQDRPSVDDQFPVHDADGAKAEISFDRLGRAFLIVADGTQVIEVRIFGTPEFRVLHATDGGHLPLREARTGEVVFHARRGLREARADAVAAIHLRHDVQVLDAGLGARFQVALAGNTGIAPEVLAFQVSAVAPAEDLHGDECVLAGLDVFRDVETGLQLAVLAVADFLAVHPHAKIGGGGADGQENVTAFPVRRDLETVAVLSDVVVLRGYDGGIVLIMAVPGVLDVDIERVAVTVQLPHAGHAHEAPDSVIRNRLVEIPRACVGRLVPLEIPDTFQ